MIKLAILILYSLFHLNMHSQTKCIHVFVALCDNKYQGIVPVPEKIGNGQDPKLNLYWGAGYGVRNFFHKKTEDWIYQGTMPSGNPFILERIIFKHKNQDAYLLADAWDGAKIKECTEGFLLASNGQVPVTISHDGKHLQFGGNAQLLAYTGHDGLMDFQLNPVFKTAPKRTRDVIILACYSRNYFKSHIQKAGARPVLWTTHLMAPEAYTLKAAIDGWLLNESPEKIEIRAEETYHQYQKCGIKGARNLFVYGY